ncbi:nuclear factor 7, brain-like [Pelobates cultripes]|uniref:Nuclear factor 7, brain-like n=1 Tax=Pelobates cultripes TaxID=61616 RepID=A0AAD1SL11_PELCU|nr:nuclear factor 7, brain-like [Pelobates cultripes]
MEDKDTSTLEPKVVLLNDVKLQLLRIKEESWEMIDEFEDKIMKLKVNSARDKERTYDLFQDLQELLRKEGNMHLTENEIKEEKAMTVLETAILDLTEISTNITDQLEKMESNSSMRRFLIKTKKKKEMLTTQLKAMDGLETQFNGFMSPLHLRDWKGMRHIVKPIPEPLQFDPESAHPNLILSPDLRQVKYSHSTKKLKGSKLCFEPGLYVLGIPGFQSGRHYWEVYVGNRSNWVIGIVKESVERKGVHVLSPQNGYWVIRKQTHNTFYGIGDPPLSLVLKNQPTRIGVCLDFFVGHVAFYDADTTLLLFQFNDFQVKEKMFAFFCPGIAMQDEDWCSLTLCP